MTVLFIFILILAGTVIVTVTGSFLAEFIVFTPQFRDGDGKVLPGSIAEFRRIRLGGNSQAVLIRGRSTENPVLLFLHAGPGMSETGMMRNINPVLEDYFTVVYLDQRGAAKSYSPFNRSSDMNEECLVNDIHELTQYLKKRFGKEKIVIMGHSFGAGFSALAASRYGEDYSVCIGVAQPVCSVECDRRSYPYMLDLVIKEGNAAAEKELRSVEGFWNSKDRKVYLPGMMVLKKWVGYYGGQFYGKKSFAGYILKNTLCSEYTVFDYITFFLGMGFSGNASWRILTTFDLRRDASTFTMPFVIIDGRHDINSFTPLVEEYYDLVEAPSKKIFWFDNSAHFPLFEENERFIRIMIDEILPLAISENI